MRNIVRFLMTAFALALMGLGYAAVNAQGPNLLTNPGFEEGYHNQSGIAEIAVPNGWRMHWLDGQTFAGAVGVANRPETVVWYIQDAPMHERPLFWRDGSYTLKIFKGGTPMYAALSQDVTGLQVGQRYQFAVPIYPDIVAEYTPSSKVAPSRADSALVRLGSSPAGALWRDEGQINYSGWWSGESIGNFYLNYNVFIHEFTATHESMTVWVEMAARENNPNNGFFIDGLALQSLGQAAAPPPPSGGGNPAPAAPIAPAVPLTAVATPDADGVLYHTVQSGDSMWSIAARAGLTLDELLEYNNLSRNAFIQAGQRLIIGYADPPAPEPEEEEETALTVMNVAEEGEEPEPTDTPEPEATPTPAGGDICLTAFDDLNENGRRDAGEPLRAAVAFTISDGRSVVSNYVTDGVSEPYCIEGLAAGGYQITRSRQTNEQLTTPGDWAIALTDGAVMNLEFGSVISAPEVAAAPEMADADEPSELTGNDPVATGGDSVAGAVMTADTAQSNSDRSWPGILLIGAVGLAALLFIGVLAIILSARRVAA
jgi:hypothetical protein